MAHSIAIIGSFRNEANYDMVKEMILLFKKNGLAVLSPAGSEVVNSIEKFVIFETDNKDLSPSEIQLITLDKILKADIVYVCNRGGYVGKTTCYEIGFCLSRSKPIYFMERPDDLPVSISSNHIVDKETLVDIAMHNREESIKIETSHKEVESAINSLWTISKKNESQNTIPKRVLICGSMKFYEDMETYRDILLSRGVNCLIPKDENSLPDDIDEEQFLDFKRRVSNAYLKKIRDKSTSAVLVFNAKKNGIENYIGANTFVELAMAFSWSRKIYLFYDIYEPYADELKAWKVVPLKGDLDIMIRELQDIVVVKEEEEYKQITINDLLESDE